MIRAPIIHRALALATLALCGGCDFVSQFPVITAFRPTWAASSPEKRLAATIVQNDGPLTASLRVRCELFFKTTRGRLPNVRSIDAERLAGNVFNCLLPTNLVIRNNHVLVFEWLVESVSQQGTATPVARSGQQEFHVSCDNPEQFLRNDQAEVRNRFGGMATTVDVAQAGYLPTHPTTITTFASGLIQVVPTNKVFRGMGVAFAKAQEILAAGNFVPSGLPQLGRPSLLMFLPSQTVAGRPDLARPTAAYSLIGWAYAVNLSTAPGLDPPSVGCFPLHEWFFHEEGHHTLDGGFSPGLGSAIGAPHARLWDLHVWADTVSGVPKLGILNVTGAGGAVTPAAGFTAPANSFFFPASIIP